MRVRSVLKRPLLAVLGAALVAATAPVLTTSASAAPPDHARSSGSTTAAERDATRAYWTAERRANAIPGELRIADRRAPGDRRVETGPPTTVAPAAKPTDKPGKPGGGGDGTTAVTGATWTLGGAVADTTGKVFFTLDGTNYVCSGSVVTSAVESLVLTAGHCLNEGPGEFATRFAFVPAYAGNGGTQTGPYGVWASVSLHTTSQWSGAGDFNYDVGFAVVETRNGVTLEDTVLAAQGIAFNQPRDISVHAFGYPAASPYDGTTLTYCSGTTSPDPYGYSTQGLVCDMTGGSSGGPWYQSFNEGTGVGTAYSVNSYRYTRGKHSNKMFGPYFGTVVQSLYGSVQS